MRTVIRLVPILCLLALLAGCGSGFVAIFSSDGSSTSAPPPPTTPPPPALTTIQSNTAPLRKQDADLLWQANVLNYELPLDLNRVRVLYSAFNGILSEQEVLRVPNVSTVQFLYDNKEIREHAILLWGPENLDKHDVEAELFVLVDGKQIAPPIKVMMVKAPAMEIENQPAQKLLSPNGQTVNVILKSISLREPTDPNKYVSQLIDFNRLSATVGFGPQITDRRSAEIVSGEIEKDGDLRLSVSMPRVDRPIQGHLVVDSVPSGRSNLVSNLFYRPQIFGPSPLTGPSEGGTSVVLIGRAMIPTSEKDPQKLDLDAITLTIRKGGRETVIPRNRISEESTPSSILFVMPPAPDGRPGPADIELSVTLRALGSSEVVVEAKSTNTFSYGDTQPYFGLRGAQLRSSASAVRFSPFIDTKSSAVDALVVTAGPGGMPYASVLGTRGNGLFTRFGQRVRTGLTSDSLQRNPVDICIANFVGDETNSGLIINRGSGGFARHSFVLGSTTSNPPITFNEKFVLDVEAAGRACAVGDFNEDDVADLIVVGAPPPGTNNATPVLFLSDGQPNVRFKKSDFSTYDPPFDFEAVDVADVDGDNHLDVLFAAGGLTPRLMIAFGTGKGTFPKADVVDLTGRTLDLGAAAYTTNVDSRVVGVHAVGAPRSLTVAIVLSGVAKSTASPPAIVHLRRGTTARTFDTLKSSDIQKFAGGGRLFTTSAKGDLDGDGSMEIAVAAAGDVAEPIRLFQRTSATVLSQVVQAFAPGPEPMTGVQAVSIGVATAPGRHHQQKGRRALFVTHAQSLTSGTEHRVSTFLVVPGTSNPKVASPHAARRVNIPIRGVALGEFFPKVGGAGKSLDAWVAVDDGLIHFRNDGLGELTAGAGSTTAVDILPGTLTSVMVGDVSDPMDQTHVPVFLTSDGRLGYVQSKDPTKALFAGGSTPVDLRTFAPAHSDPKKNLRLRPLQSNSQILHADVNADSRSDLIVLLGLGEKVDEGAEGEGVLLLLPGKAAPKAGEFPFDLPKQAKSIQSLTHGNVSSVAVADFVASLESNFLELAVALPRGGSLGNEVRFYHWDAKEERFDQSFASKDHHALPVGNEPSRIVTGDYNRDGRPDIAVASRNDDRLWVFYNVSSPTSSRKVDLTKFQGAEANPLPLPPGDPKQMITTDVNGDAIPDVLLTVETSSTTTQYEVVFFLSPGSLAGSGVRAIPHERTGNLVWTSGSWAPRDGAARVGLGDLNGDGAPDLVLGWATVGAGDYNLRVLFGNNF